MAVVVGMEWETPKGRNAAFVISRDGVVEGFQPKNQIPREEERHYVAEGSRRLFEVDGVPFGITICTKAGAIRRVSAGQRPRARKSFSPPTDRQRHTGPTLTRWGDPDAPYYEKAMLMRSIENTVTSPASTTLFRYQERLPV